MKLGVTATRAGLTMPQRLWFAKALRIPEVEEFHHGDCIGGDEQCHAIADMFLDSHVSFHIHPPDVMETRANCKSKGREVVMYQPRSYHDRDGDIVRAIDTLYGFPGGYEERLRSGTWYTMGLAKVAGIYLVICFPDGTTKGGETWVSRYKSRMP